MFRAKGKITDSKSETQGLVARASGEDLFEREEMAVSESDPWNTL